MKICDISVGDCIYWRPAKYHPVCVVGIDVDTGDITVESPYMRTTIAKSNELISPPVEPTQEPACGGGSRLVGRLEEMTVAIIWLRETECLADECAGPCKKPTNSTCQRCLVIWNLAIGRKGQEPHPGTL